jgi:antitoxin component YwqK of YwqJK toxin-antitoxin module
LVIFLLGRQPDSDFHRQRVRLPVKTFLSMPNARPFARGAAGLLLVFLSFCKNSPLETVENRDARGHLERYQRRKADFVREGLYQRFSPQGVLLEETHYRSDSLEGERKYFYPNGALESVENFKKGAYDGPYRKFYPDGKVQIEQTFVNGAMQGLSLRYYPSGALQEKVTMLDSEENGPFEEYHENGQLRATGTYSPGEEQPLEQGELREYDENGHLVRVADCHDGRCLTRN